MTAPFLYHLCYVVPIHRLIQQISEVARNRLGGIAATCMGIELWQAEGFVGDIIDAPHRFDGKLDHATKGQFKRNGESGAQIPFPVTADNRIHGQQHCVDASLLGPLHHRTVQFTVLVEIELVNLRRVIFCTQLFQCHSADGRYPKHGAIFRCGGGHGAFSIMME